MKESDLNNAKNQLAEEQRQIDDWLKETAPALWWGMHYHINSRGESMNYDDVPYLVALYTAIERDEKQVIEKSVQCFPGNTVVTTPTGYVPIRDVKVGDLVLTHQNRYLPVTKTFSREIVEPGIEMQGWSTGTVVSTDEHPFLSYPYEKEKYHHTRYESVFFVRSWTEASSLTLGDFVVRPKIPVPSSRYTLNLMEYSDREIREYDADWFREKCGQRSHRENVNLDRSFGLLVGLYLSEGWINQGRVCFGFHYDEEHLEQHVRQSVSELYQGEDFVHTYLNASDNCRRVFANSYVLAQFFKTFGLNCNDKQLPSFLLDTNEEFLRGVFDGVMLGDGNRTASQSRLTTTSKALAEQVKFIGSMFGYFGVIREENPADKLTVYRLVFSDPDHRLSSKFVDLDNHVGTRIRSLKKVELAETVYNLEVAGDNSYVANDYVVHNCGLSELYIIKSHIEAARGLSVMYVLPKYELRNRFVNNRIYKLHRRVPHYSALIRENRQGGIHRTSLMHFGKGTLAYVGSNVESEFIEMPIDSAFVDEKDRCNQTNLLMLPDRYTASPYKFHREISNPTVEGFGIDARYLESSQAEWHIKCPHCGNWFVPDFFRHVVREIGTKIYEPRDPLYVEENEHLPIRLICDKCDKPVNRLSDGEWVHQYQNKIWKGYRISKVFNKYTPLRELFDKWVDAQNHETKIQVFYNSDLGLPYSSAGSKITATDLNRCKRQYPFRRPETAVDRPRLIGIDVGSNLHYVVRDLVRENGVPSLRMVDVGSVPSFELLMEEVLDKWRPRITVIDAQPEIHKVMELKGKYSNAWSSHFQEGKRKIESNKKDREITMDRTALLDYVKQYVDSEIFLLPKDAEFLDNGQYYKHMQASTRILQVDEEKIDKAKFEWVHTTDDHYFLAEAYCVQALLMMPNIDDVIGFFKANTPRVRSMSLQNAPNLTDEEKAELERLNAIRPEVFLDNLRKNNRS